jgi:hypothetical protein
MDENPDRNPGNHLRVASMSQTSAKAIRKTVTGLFEATVSDGRAACPARLC